MPTPVKTLTVLLIGPQESGKTQLTEILTQIIIDSEGGHTLSVVDDGATQARVVTKEKVNGLGRRLLSLPRTNFKIVTTQT